MRIFRETILILAFACLPFGFRAVADSTLQSDGEGRQAGVSSKADQSQAKKPSLRKKHKNKNTQKKLAPAAPKINAADAEFAKLKKKYRLGEISKKVFWEGLSDLEEKGGLSVAARQSLLQMEANILLEDGYPIVASLYASDILKNAANPLNDELKPTWVALSKASKKRATEAVLEDLAGTLNIKSKPPAFENEWHYFVGNAAESRGDHKKALDAYRTLKMSDRYFIPGKYQTAMIYLEKEDFANAEASLKSILDTVPQELSPYREEVLSELNNYAKLALARLYYQTKNFKKAIVFYRSIDRDSELFYDSIFEQAWAFFMAGYPNHALGALHGAESPFFAEKFNPETSMLKAMVYYWMCRYEDSRGALADFIEHHSDSVEALSSYLDRKYLPAETAYQLFEDLVTGVSGASLGIPRKILLTAAEQDSMKLLREQFAAVVAEMDRIEGHGILGTQHGSRRPNALLRGMVHYFKTKIGEQFVIELKGLKHDYDRLYDQSQFLYVELLMSEKEQLLGRELHASSKIDRISTKKDVAGWGHDTQSWGGKAYKGEFWEDEIGFYIYNVKPQCKTSE